MGGQNYRILIVDDMEEIRDILQDAFKRAGYRCEIARDGIAATNLMSIYDFDLVITDLAMPKMNGHKLVQDILSKPMPPMVVVITGVADPRLVRDLILRGVDDIMQKPVSPVLLVAKCAAMLERRGAYLQAGGAEANSPEMVAKRLASARHSLEQQLSQVTNSFQATITQLQNQQQEMEAGLMGSVRLFTSLLGKMGSTGSSHVGRVELIAVELGKLLGMGEDAARDLKLAALLHDIGQFGMPDDIRAASLWNMTEEQRKVFELYPDLGAALLGEVPGLQTVAASIQSHCENYDGSGFPKGLKGEAIPLPARILRISDGCDLAYMHRGDERPIELLRDHLIEQSGIAYDPALVSRIMPMLTRVYRQFQGKPESMPASQVPEGHFLAEDVYDNMGHFLARSGVRVTFQLRQHLTRFLGEQHVFVLPPSEELVSTSD
jgi:response regulator RpfG family c-di-GMP phosphodiesterase